MNLFIYQLYQAALTLKRKPGLTTSVVVTMGLALGALLTALTLYYVLVLKPLPYPEQDRLVLVDMQGSVEVPQRNFTYEFNNIGALMSLYRSKDRFEQTAMATFGSDILVNSPSARSINLAFVSPEWFDIWGADIIRGRAFEQTEQIDVRNPVAVISYELWQQEFGGSDDIFSQSVTFSGTAFRIVGIVNKEHIAPQLAEKGVSPDVWLPWGFNFLAQKYIGQNLDPWENNYQERKVFVIGRLKASESAASTARELTRQLNNDWQQKGPRQLSMATVSVPVLSMKEFLLSSQEMTLYMLIAGALGLLLIAITNITNLFYSRLSELQFNLAVQAALGARKQQIFSAVLSEMVILMAAALLLAIGLSQLGVVAVQSYLSSELPRTVELNLSWFTYLIATLLLVLLSLLFAWLGTRKINYAELNRSLITSGKGTGVQVTRRSRLILTSIQVASVTALLVVTLNLFYNSYQVITAPTDINIQDRYSLTLSFDGRKRPPEKEVGPFNQELVELFSLQPQVERVAQSTSYYWQYGGRIPFTYQGKEVHAGVLFAGNSYFEIFKQPLLSGEAFTQADFRWVNPHGGEQNTQPSVIPDFDERQIIINDKLARLLSPDIQSLQGKKLPMGRVKGIVKAVKLPGEQRLQPRFYFPMLAQRTHFLFQFKAGQHLNREQIVQLIKSQDPRWTVGKYFSLQEEQDRLMFTDTTISFVTGSITLFTIFLASVGMYGMFSYSARMRKREIGTRAALGATSKRITWMMLVDNLHAVLIGCTIGALLLAVGCYIYVQDMATIISLKTLVIVLLTAGIIGTVTWLATYLPLREYLCRPPMYCLRVADE